MRLKYLFLLVFYFCVNANSQVNIEEVNARVSSYWTVHQSHRVEALHSRPAFNLLGRFDLSKKFNSFQNCDRDGDIMKFICRSPNRDWFAEVSYLVDQNSSLIYIHEISLFSCELRDWELVKNDLIAKNGSPKNGFVKGSSLTYENEGQQLSVGMTSSHINFKSEIVCPKEKYINYTITRTQRMNKILIDEIYRWRFNQSRNTIPKF